MRFEDEQYVRLYKRDTTTWLMLNWQGRCILPLVLRKVDRAGILELGEDGYEALAAHIQVPLEVVTEGMDSILRRKILILRDDGLLVWPRFIEAQEAKQSDKARQKTARDRARDLASAEAKGVTVRDETVTTSDATVTPRDETVTSGHTASHGVTLSCAVNSLTVHSSERAGAQDAEGSASPGSERTPTVAEEVESKTDLRKRTKGSRGSRLPEGWKPSANVLAWAAKEGIRDPLGPLDEFADYWRGVAGQRGVKADWDSTYRNRLRQLVEAGRIDVRKPSARPVPAPPTKRDPPLSAEERSAALKQLEDATVPQLFRDVIGGR